MSDFTPHETPTKGQNFHRYLQKRRTLPAFNELDPYLLLNFIIYDYANLQLLSSALKKTKATVKIFHLIFFLCLRFTFIVMATFTFHKIYINSYVRLLIMSSTPGFTTVAFYEYNIPKSRYRARQSKVNGISGTSFIILNNFSNQTLLRLLCKISYSSLRGLAVH